MPLRRMMAPQPPPQPSLQEVQDWSIKVIGTNTLLPGRVDIGIRLNHDEYLWLFEQALSPEEALSILAYIAIGALSLDAVLAKPKAGRYRDPESVLEVPDSILTWPLSARAWAIRAALCPFLFPSGGTEPCTIPSLETVLSLLDAAQRGHSLQTRLKDGRETVFSFVQTSLERSTLTQPLAHRQESLNTPAERNPLMPAIPDLAPPPSPRRQPRRPPLEGVQAWSIEVAKTATLLRGRVDVGIRINHDEIVWVFAVALDRSEVQELLSRIAQGYLSLEEIMAYDYGCMWMSKRDKICTIAFTKQEGGWRSSAGGKSPELPSEEEVTREELPMPLPPHVKPPPPPLWPSLEEVQQWSMVIIDASLVARGQVVAYPLFCEEPRAPIVCAQAWVSDYSILNEEYATGRFSVGIRFNHSDWVWALPIPREHREAEAILSGCATEYSSIKEIMTTYGFSMCYELPEGNEIRAITFTRPASETPETLDKPEAGEYITKPSSLLATLDLVPSTPGGLLSPEEVMHYVRFCGCSGGLTESGDPPTILECRAMSSKQAEEMMYTFICWDDRPVIYVKAHGPFMVPKIGARGVQNMHEVFDARTGHVLVWGVTA